MCALPCRSRTGRLDPADAPGLLAHEADVVAVGAAAGVARLGEGALVVDSQDGAVELRGRHILCRRGGAATAQLAQVSVQAGCWLAGAGQEGHLRLLASLDARPGSLTATRRSVEASPKRRGRVCAPAHHAGVLRGSPARPCGRCGSAPVRTQRSWSLPWAAGGRGRATSSCAAVPRPQPAPARAPGRWPAEVRRSGRQKGRPAPRGPDSGGRATAGQQLGQEGGQRAGWRAG